MNKKALGAVVATALLIVVAVVAVVGFQGWFTNFSSETTKDVDEKSDSGKFNTGIETVVGNYLYFKNGFGENLTINSIRIGNNDCGITGNYSNGIQQLNISSCIYNVTTNTPEIVVFTEKGVFVKKLYLEKIENSINNPISYLFVGNQSWFKKIDFTGNDEEAYSVVSDDLGNIYLTGSPVNVIFGYITIKLNSSGDLVWSRNFTSGGAKVSRGIDIDSNRNIVVSGQTDADFLTLKYDFDGNLIWNKTFDEGFTERAYDVSVDNDDNVVVTGFTNKFGNLDSFIVKYNSNGDLLWNKTIQIPTNERMESVAIDKFNNIYITGVKDSSVNPDYFIIKLNSSGAEIWNKTYDSNSGNAWDTGYGIVIDNDNNVIVTGRSYVNGYNYDIHTFKFDSLGNELWNISFNSIYNNSDSGYDLEIDGQNNIYISGIIFNGVNNDLIGLKYDLNGNLLWNLTYTANNIDEGYGVTVDNEDNPIFVGSGTTSLGDFLIIKYD